VHNAQMLTIFVKKKKVLKMFQTSYCSMTGFHTIFVCLTFCDGLTFGINIFFLGSDLCINPYSYRFFFLSKIVVYFIW